MRFLQENPLHIDIIQKLRSMTKEEWQALYNKLNQYHSDFIIAYDAYQRGSNKQKREIGKRNAFSAMNSADNLLSNNQEAYNLLFKDDTQGFHYAEFKDTRWFKSDMREFLTRIKGFIG